MTKQQIVPAVKLLIADIRYKEALKFLSDYVKGIDSYLENDLLMLTASFNRNTRDAQRSLLNREDYNIAMARLTNGLNAIMERLPAKGNDVKIEGVEEIERFQTQPTAQNKILFLTANPNSPAGDRLNTEREMREVKDALERTTAIDQFKLIFEPAARINTITGAMNKHEPQIIHFSGHGYNDEDDPNEPKGIVVENNSGEYVIFPTSGLDLLFELTHEHVECVLLNACYSSIQAEVISRHNIYVIGMSDAIDDDVAIQFAVGFYQSLGEKTSIKKAYGMAKVNISYDIDSAPLPELWHNGEKISK